MITKTVHDYRIFDKENFGQLLTSENRHNFDISVDTDVQWEIIYQYSMEILSVMCPYKKVQTPKNITPWLTQEIYAAIRNKKDLSVNTKQQEILKLCSKQKSKEMSLIAY